MDQFTKFRGRINSYFDSWEPIEIAAGVLISVAVFKGVRYIVFNYEGIFIELNLIN